MSSVKKCRKMVFFVVVVFCFFFDKAKKKRISLALKYIFNGLRPRSKIWMVALLWNCAVIP